MENSLTRGAIEDILDGREPLNPICQLLGTKPMNNQSEGFGASNDDRKYRLMISDGMYSHQYCIVSNQDIIEDIRVGNLEKFSIIKLKTYKIMEAADSNGSNKKILYILNLDIVKSGRDVRVKLGNPIARNENKSINDTSIKPMETDSMNGNHNRSTFNPPPEPVPKSYNNDAYSNSDRSNLYNDNSTQPQPYPFANNHKNDYQPTVPPKKDRFDSSVIEINQLSPYVGKWTVKGRVISKSSIKTWSNAKGEGKLFSFEIADKTGKLKVAGFQNECDKFFEYIQPNKVYYISRAILKPANKNYTSADYEVTLQQDSQIQECTDSRETSDMPTQKFTFVTISSLPTLPPGQSVDLMGVIQQVSECTTIMSKSKSKELKKRNITIVDMSRYTVSLTLWGELGENFKGIEGDILVTKEARLSDYGGRTASAGDYTVINPDLPETRKLRNWFSNLVDNNFTHLTTSQDISSNDQWKPLASIMDIEQVRNGAGPGKVKASIIMIGRNATYRACPTDGCGKKLVDTPTNEMRCEKCQQTFTHCKYRFKTDVKLTDASGQYWVTLWDEKAEALLGHKPEEIHKLTVSDDKDQYERVLSAPYFRSYIFSLRASINTYNSEDRVRTTVLRMEPLDPVVYGRHLIEDIRHMTSGVTVN